MIEQTSMGDVTKVMYDLSVATTAVAGLESLYSSDTNVHPSLIKATWQSIGLEVVSTESIVENLKSFWNYIVVLIVQAKNAIVKWIATLLSSLGIMKGKCDNLAKQAEAASRSSLEDSFGSKYNVKDDAALNLQSIVVRKPDAYVFDGDLVGLNISGLEAVRSSVNDNPFWNVISDKGSDFCKLMNGVSIKERDDLNEFMSDFNILVTEFNAGVSVDTVVCTDYDNPDVLELSLADYPGHGKYIITRKSDTLPYDIEFIGGGIDVRNNRNKEFSAPALQLNEVKTFALTLGNVAGDVINAKRQLKSVVALDNAIIDSGKKLLARMDREVYDDTDYHEPMRKCMTSMNLLGMSSRKAYIGVIRNATLALSGGYIFAADCYRNLTN